MENEDIKVGDILDAYIADRFNPHADRKCKHPKSCATHLLQVRHAWGDMRIAEFSKGSRGRVRETLARWRDVDKTSSSTCRKRLSHFKAAIRFAIDEELMPRAFEPVIKLPPSGAPRERYLSEDELARLMAAADRTRTRAHTLLGLELFLRTGLRPSAIVAVTWDLVDFENRIIRFRDTEAFEDRSKKRRVNKPMDDDLYAIMQTAYAQRESEDCPFVIQWNGKGVKTLYPAMKRLFKRAGLGDLQVRDLRRSSATFVHNESGGDALAAAGHIGDTEKVARKHYIQEDPRVNLPAQRNIDRLIKRARAARPRAYADQN